MKRLDPNRIIQILLILSLVFWGQFLFAQPQPDVFSPLPDAQTPCGFSGTRITFQPTIPLLPSPKDVSSGRDRYGICYAGNTSSACRVGGKELCRVDEAVHARINELYVRLGVCKCVSPGPNGECKPLFPTPQKIQDIGLTIGSLARLETEVRNCEGGSGTTTGICPKGQSCQPPCPICPVCTPCSPTADSVVYTKDRLPENGLHVYFWDRYGQFLHEGARIVQPQTKEGVWITRGGKWADADIYAWKVILPTPEIK